MISIIIVTYKRVELLKRLLLSLEKALIKQVRFKVELLIVVNGVDDFDSSKYLEEKNIKHKIIDSCTPGEARNVAIDLACGDWLVFFDDDVEVPDDYFLLAQKFLDKFPQADVFGGPDRYPKMATAKEEALGITLSSPLATSITRFRHIGGNQKNAPIYCDETYLILCNLWMKSEIFKRDGLRFDGRFYRNEENVLLAQLMDKKLFFVRELYVYHARRAAFFKVARATMLSGKMRLRSIFAYHNTFRIIYFIPSIFVFYLAFVSWFIVWPFYIYLLTVFFASLFLVVQKKRSHLLTLVIFYHIVLNISYGIGFWHELFTVFFRPAQFDPRPLRK